MNWLGRTAVMSLALAIGAWLLPGVEIDGFSTLIIVAILIGLFNAFVRPIFIFLTIPITLVTLGLFLFAINAIMILMVDSLVDDFTVSSFWWALLLSGVVSLIRSVLEPSKNDRAQPEAGQIPHQ
jgi:putative membrane protein